MDVNSISEEWQIDIAQRIKTLYGGAVAGEVADRLIHLVAQYMNAMPVRQILWDETAVVLITYGDSVVRQGERPLQTLKQLVDAFFQDAVSTIHILPFFPYSSDDGFSVIDFRQVNPVLGNWQDVEDLGRNFSMMFDLVINHVSVEHAWFKNFLAQQEPGKDYFIVPEKSANLNSVVRPRSHPLLTAFDTAEGKKHVWTTFSADQVDLNFSNPAVLLEMIKVLLYYVKRGAKIIRLDAIAFLWKEPGTRCLHMEQTHEVVRLLRDVVDMVAPGTVLLTETNVPHHENIAYFGVGDEAHMVYQFSLPPLLLHALLAGNAFWLNSWAARLPVMKKGNTWFNFTASHDGIGVRPLEGLLPEEQRDVMVDHVKSEGGHISMKRNEDGTESPYEMNITYFDALGSTFAGGDDLQIERFICSQTITMVLQGIPAFYIHSFFATPNWYKGVVLSGRARTINRRKWDADELQAAISSLTPSARVMSELLWLLRIRNRMPHFHPHVPMRIIALGDAFFAVERNSAKVEGRLISVSNITAQHQAFNLRELAMASDCIDLIRNQALSCERDEEFVMEPYQTIWLSSK